MTDKSAIQKIANASVYLACLAPSISANVSQRITASGPMAVPMVGLSVMSVIMAASVPYFAKIEPSRAKRMTAYGVFALCVSFNLATALGVTGATRAGSVDSRSTAAEKHDTLKNQVSSVEDALVILAKAAGNDVAATLKATLATMKSDPLWARSKQCTIPTMDDSRAFCDRHNNMAARAANADSRDAKQAELSRLREELKNSTGGNVGPADPQATGVQWLLSLIGVTSKAAGVGVALDILAAFVIEALSSFGPYILNGVINHHWTSRNGRREMHIERAPSYTVPAMKDKADAQFDVPTAPVEMLPAPIAQPESAPKVVAKKTQRALPENVTALHPIDRKPGWETRAWLRETLADGSKTRAEVMKLGALKGLSEGGIDGAMKALQKVEEGIVEAGCGRRPAMWSLASQLKGKGSKGIGRTQGKG